VPEEAVNANCAVLNTPVNMYNFASITEDAKLIRDVVIPRIAAEIKKHQDGSAEKIQI
jgi:hypothetical protein